AGCEPVGIEEIGATRRRKIDGGQEAAENSYAINQAGLYSFHAPGNQWIHGIEREAHPASITNIAPQISYGPMNMLPVKKVVADLGNEIMPNPHSHKREAAE